MAWVKDVFSSQAFCLRKYRSILVVSCFSAVMEYFMTIWDSIVCGHFIGEDALAAVNLLIPMMGIITFTAGLIGAGTGINVSLSIGRCDERRAMEYFSQGLWTVLIFGGVLALAMLLGQDVYFRFTEAGPETVEMARVYWNRLIPIALQEPIILFLLNACYVDDERTLVSTAYAVQVVINCFLSFVLVASGNGTLGCAIGNFVGNALSIIILLFHFIRRENTFRIVCHFSWRDMLSILTLSFGDSCAVLFTAILYITINKFVVTCFGPSYLTAVSLVIATYGFIEFLGGFGSALQTIGAVYQGEENTRILTKLTTHALIYAFLAGLGFVLVAFFYPDSILWLVGLKGHSERTLLHHVIQLISLSIPFSVLCDVYNSHLVIIEQGHRAMAFTFLSSILMPVAGMLCGSFWGMNGAWLGFSVSFPIGITAYLIYVRYKYGKEMFPYQIPRHRMLKNQIYDFELTEEAVKMTAEKIRNQLQALKKDHDVCCQGALLIETLLAFVGENNPCKKIHCEVSLDWNDELTLTIRDDGKLFNALEVPKTTENGFHLEQILAGQKKKFNFMTNGCNRNVFKF